MIHILLIISLFSPLSGLWHAWESTQEFIEMQKNYIQSFSADLLGEFRWFLLGASPEEADATVCGKGEVSHLIRITAINGILNQKSDWLAFIQSISDSHGGVNVHALYWHSGGWTNDLIKAMSIQSGVTTQNAKALASLWKEMIEEMGGIDSAGEILHYAHSIGAAETYMAKSFMTKEELEKIRVITFGTPYIFNPGHFQEVTHYISVRDGISMLDPVTYFQSLQSGKEHVIFIGEYEGPPMVDHFVVYGSYRDKLEEKGIEFIHQFGSVEDYQ